MSQRVSSTISEPPPLTYTASRSRARTNSSQRSSGNQDRCLEQSLAALDNLVIDEKDFWLFETISSPINGDENLVREVELIRRNLFKPLLGSFPCTVWNVFYSKLHAPGWQDSSTDYAQLESRDVIGPFASQKEAESATRAKLLDLESNNGIERKHYSSKQLSRRDVFGIVYDGTNNEDLKWIVDIKTNCDSVVEPVKGVLWDKKKFGPEGKTWMEEKAASMIPSELFMKF
ncbi:hypothetical protein CBER1_06984 [Cercospora berteroae]|uniref:Uncharacterized protein n=1 Tax=Cercospora berteroae TaxID=357750 RepID=A0A2S6BSA9_9PEZI|nr:hypothetical protein CBER1_06984 [Cercospora berteroae]